jgi:hypothetical protein
MLLKPTNMIVRHGGGVQPYLTAAMYRWIEEGPQWFKPGGDTAPLRVEIIDKTPMTLRVSAEDGLELGWRKRRRGERLATAYAWQHGWRWCDPSMKCSAHTIPEEVFQLLPPCPYPAVNRDSKLLRWPTAEEAVLALNQAAWTWAATKAQDPSWESKKVWWPGRYETDIVQE